MILYSKTSSSATAVTTSISTAVATHVSTATRNPGAQEFRASATAANY